MDGIFGPIIIETTALLSLKGKFLSHKVFFSQLEPSEKKKYNLKETNQNEELNLCNFF